MYNNMKTLGLLLGLLVLPFLMQAQAVAKKLESAIKTLQADSQMKSGIVSLYVVNTKTGVVVYDRNANVGLAAASSQKVITSATAFELLGSTYRFKTALGYDGKIENGTLDGNFFITGYGDPTLGSWRYFSNTEQAVMTRWMSEIKKLGIQTIKGDIYLDGSKFSFQPVPGGWIWDDIGNYYGAGVWGLNWHENQYDLILKPGHKEGDDVQILRTEPALQGVALFNFLKTGKSRSGDNAYIYLPPYSGAGFVNGTVPAGRSEFKIRGSFPNPALQIEDELKRAFKANTITTGKDIINSMALQVVKQEVPKASKIFYEHFSPPLDSINYFFLKESINLYGEALLKAVALEQKGEGSLEEGIKSIKNFWKEKGVDITALNIADGSGLSPQNRVTTKALASVMRYAASRPWYSSFYNALPEYNGLKMKSGTISGAKSFTGYVNSKDGNTYTFAIVINNYNGPSSGVVQKMYKVLDLLK
jgi:D-alanyl-D-alanine carboxypeptidase/D-alanyl-D-alanine-endopeptidase (penicillin-binding protein 4)